MKSLTKKIVLGICMLTLAAGLIGCSDLNTYEQEEKGTKEEGSKTEGTKEESKDETTDDKDKIMEEAYSEEMAKYFPAVEGTVLIFSGTVEYGQTLTLNGVIKNDDKLVLNFKGEIEDLSGGEGLSREERILETTYEINKDSIKEIRKNETRRHSQSIIREQVVLKLPVEEGNKWTQEVMIDNKTYEAETTIIDISKDNKGKSLVKTETRVPGMEEYPDKVYKEVRVYKEGKGLVEYNTTILLAGESQEKMPFEFGYRLFEEE